MSSILIGASILLMACQLPGVTRPREDVYLTQSEFTNYYQQFERRMNDWFCDKRQNARACLAAPDVPDADDEYSNFRFIETGAAKVWGGTCTCSHGNGSTVVIPSDEWDGGCTPHEIGHGVLKRLGHPCWRRYEHRPNLYDAPEDCKIERQTWQ